MYHGIWAVLEVAWLGSLSAAETFLSVLTTEQNMLDPLRELIKAS
jgi:hypothetical protein